MFQITLLVSLIILNACNCQRRIINGRLVKTEKKYMVYLVQADIDPQNYDYWLCGGALVTRSFILTSAACVEDVKYLYAIAGYRKYVINEYLSIDDCIKNTKKKIVYTCVPKMYNFNYDRTDRWAYIDIALAKTEAPFSKLDPYYKYCDYVPAPIAINYDKRYQDPGVDAFVLGWGHRKIWRQPEDYKNYNEAYLRYASTKVINKTYCKEQYSELKDMDKVIDEYMLCTLYKGDLNENGTVDKDSSRVIEYADGCSRRDYVLGRCNYDARRLKPPGVVIRDKSYTYKGKTYKFNSDEYVWFNDGEVKVKKKRLKGNPDDTGSEQKDENFAGICQNDHGGPLVTWVGAHEEVIGVASVFKVNRLSECVGPFLFTSTQCNGKFLSCILEAHDENARRRLLCDSAPEVKGFDTLENRISWKHHKDGPAANEL